MRRFTVFVLFVGLLLVGCGGGGGGGSSPSPTPTASATTTPPAGGTPTITTAEHTTGGKNTILILHGTNLYGPYFKIDIAAIDGTVLENAFADDGTAVSGFVQAKPASLAAGTPYPVRLFVSSDNVHFTQAADPLTGPITFTYN